MHKPTILVVDQRLHFFDALADTSLAATKRLEHADHTEPALARLEQGGVDAVVCDSGAPGTPGHDFLAAVAMRWPRVCRLLIVDARSVEGILPAVNAGEIQRFFTRPAQAPRVMVEIDELLAARDRPAAVGPDEDEQEPEGTEAEGGGDAAEPAADDDGMPSVISLDGDAAMADIDDLLAEFRAELDPPPGG